MPYSLGNEIALKVGASVDDRWYKHTQIKYKDELFENHLYFVLTRNGKSGKALENELEETLTNNDYHFEPLTSSSVQPPIRWTAMFLTYHALAHFISEGLRLKQVLDWAMFLKKYQNDVDWELYYKFCERYHLRRFSDAITAICVEYLGVKLDNKRISVSSPYADKVLHSLLYDDDYIYNAKEGVWKSRYHVIRNLFKYRWKYDDIYQKSVWKQLWWYVSGYFFHTENS